MASPVWAPEAEMLLWERSRSRTKLCWACATGLVLPPTGIHLGRVARRGRNLEALLAQDAAEHPVPPPQQLGRAPASASLIFLVSVSSQAKTRQDEGGLFHTEELRCPSSGRTSRALLFRPPEHCFPGARVSPPALAQAEGVPHPKGPLLPAGRCVWPRIREGCGALCSIPSFSGGSCSPRAPAGWVCPAASQLGPVRPPGTRPGDCRLPSPVSLQGAEGTVASQPLWCMCRTRGSPVGPPHQGRPGRLLRAQASAR